MRKFIIAALLQVALSTNAHTQCSVAGIFTNPAAPVNTQRPTMLNNFNWLAQKYPLNTASASPGNDSIWSPIYQPDNEIVDHIRLALDMQPGDGWELLRRETGYNQNGTPKNPKPENAYVIMYNKYSSILRVFFARGAAAAFTSARLTVKFSSASPTQTSLLDLSAGLIPISTAFVKDKLFQSPTEFDNRLHQWFFADFPMQFDPCTCYYTSRLSINVELINTANVDLSGSANGKLMAIASNTGVVNQDEKTFSFADLVGGYKKASKTFKDINKFKSDIDKALDTMFKGSPSVSNTKKTQISGLASLFGSSNFLKAGLAAAPLVGTAVSLLDFFIGGGKKAPPAGPQEVKLTPTSIDMTIKLGGTITSSYNYGGAIFWNPGSSISSYSDDDYPFYNEIMGVFNLLYLPKVNMRRSIERMGSPRDIMWTETQIDYRVDTAIKYVLNPAARLDIQDAMVALVVTGDSSDMYGPAGDYWMIEGKDEVSGKWQYRGEYVDVNCLNRKRFRIRGSSAPGNINWIPSGPTYLKFMINLKRQLDTAGAQNVLLVVKYPVQFVTVETMNDAGTSCLANRFLPATNTEINSMCISNAYKTNRVNKSGRPVPVLSNSNSVVEATVQSSILVPNPTSSYSSLVIRLSRPIRLNIYITDGSGKKVREISRDQSYPAGHSNEKIDAAGLAAGLYYVVIENGTSRIVKTLVVQR